MSYIPFPHPLDYLPRPGRREIRVRNAPTLPITRNERTESHAAESRA